MEQIKKQGRNKKDMTPKKAVGRYRSMDELSAAKMESAKEFVANLDMTLFRKNGPVE
ncbi:hypothetical protein [Spirosoma linguale]|uniref:Uncharacterized protein n=1 Tax=Spirosoma linguale (strain ATCC 33905 / DSM 74 / LMG 10896 / Claus 1) TaxID=504472 RepID=D2QFY1_SPILD|nr:hypothetical protein Slin_5478 [Spirosoma linguale DSM 74]